MKIYVLKVAHGVMVQLAESRDKAFNQMTQSDMGHMGRPYLTVGKTARDLEEIPLEALSRAGEICFFAM